MKVLGIESSCDETAVAIVDDRGKIIEHLLFSQIKEHQKYGGVVPEVAARAHLEVIDYLLEEIFRKSNLSPQEIDGFAATCGPGLIGGLIIGVLAAKTLAFVHKKPFIAVNHLVAHALLPTMFNDIKFPFLLLLVSGGHTQFVAVLSINEYKILGQTIDDAIGEAFDKSARLMGLPYPGGAHIQSLALEGDKSRFLFPKPLYKKPNCDFSFSGLKTAVREVILKNEKDGVLDKKDVQDISASLQQTIAEVVIDRTKQALIAFENNYGKLNDMVISGGVSANITLREELTSFLGSKNIRLSSPPLDLCTDNGVMIAWAGLKKLESGKSDSLSFPVKARWNLENL